MVIANVEMVQYIEMITLVFRERTVDGQNGEIRPVFRFRMNAVIRAALEILISFHQINKKKIFYFKVPCLGKSIKNHPI